MTAVMGEETDLAKKLIETPEREKAGARTAGRFEFQTLWGLALLFEEHGSKSDYAIVFEFHDDVALFDSATDPKSVRFYQVKTKGTKGGWTLKRLLSRESVATKEGAKQKPSYVDKMYDSVDKFHPDVLSVEFVSNKECTFKAEGKFSFSECDAKQFAEIVESLTEEFGDVTDAKVGLLGFRQTDLSLSDSIAHTKGKLHEFVCSELGEVKFSLEALYKAIADDCRRKASYAEDISGLGQLIEKKGVCKKDVQAWLDAIQDDVRAPSWGEIAHALTSYGYLEQMGIRREYEIVRAAALDPSDAALFRVRKAVRKELDALASSPKLSLVEIIDAVCVSCSDLAQKYLQPYSPEKLKAVIAYEIHVT